MVVRESVVDVVVEAYVDAPGRDGSEVPQPAADALVAADVMSAPAVTVSPDATIWDAWSTMMRTGLRHLVVTVGGRCVGVIDDRTVFAQWPMGPLSLRRRRVAQLMHEPTTCVLPDTPLRQVAGVMVAGGVDAVPVVDVDGTAVGIVTGSDMAAAVARA